MPNQSYRRLLIVLTIGILAVSTASILIRLAQYASVPLPDLIAHRLTAEQLADAAAVHGVPPLVIAAYRLAFATLILAPIVLRRHMAELGHLSRRDWIVAMISGVFLGLHFATWISSLAYTTITSSVVLVSTGPIWVALISWLVLRERLSRPIVSGLVVTVAGGIIVGLSDSSELGFSGAQVWGDFLALAGAWFVAGYLIIGRQLRHRMSLIAYIALVYGTAAVVLIGLALASGASFTRDPGSQPFPPIAFFWLVLLAMVPQLLGHSSYNYALRYLPTTYVAVVTLAEPIGTSILAFALLGEAPAPPTIIGAAIILIGIGIASLPARL